MNNYDTKKIIGYRLGELLQKRGVLQKDLAQYLDVKPNIVSYYFTGERTPNLETVVKIANFFNVSTDYLLGLTEAETNDKNIQFVCDYTGLSTEAIQQLNQEKRSAEDHAEGSDVLKSINLIIENSIEENPKKNFFKLFLNYLNAEKIYSSNSEFEKLLIRLYINEELSSPQEDALKNYLYGSAIPRINISKYEKEFLSLRTSLLDTAFIETYYKTEIQHVLENLKRKYLDELEKTNNNV